MLLGRTTTGDPIRLSSPKEILPGYFIQVPVANGHGDFPGKWLYNIVHALEVDCRRAYDAVQAVRDPDSWMWVKGSEDGYPIAIPRVRQEVLEHVDIEKVPAPASDVAGVLRAIGLSRFIPFYEEVPAPPR